MEIRLPISVVAEMDRLVRERPGWYIQKDKVSRQPVPRVTSLTCRVRDKNGDGTCRVPVKRVWTGRFVEFRPGWPVPEWHTTWRTVYAPPVKNHDWWGSYEQTTDIQIGTQESIDSTIADAYIMDNKFARESLLSVGKTQEGMDIPTGSWYNMFDNERGCTRPDGDGWYVCEHHSGWARVKRVLSLNLSPEATARKILFFYARPPKTKAILLPKKNMAWRWSDVENGWKVWNEEVQFQLSQGRDLKKARSIASAKMWESFPDFFPIYESSTQKKLDSGSWAYTTGRLEATRILWSMGLLHDLGYLDAEKFSVPIYRQVVRRTKGVPFTKVVEHHYASEMAQEEIPAFKFGTKCPITTSWPEGKFPALILRGLAVKHTLDEIESEDAWVRWDGYDESAVTFNARPSTERKCHKCKTCWQKNLLVLKKNEKGLRYVELAGESMLRRPYVDELASIASQAHALGGNPLSDEESESVFHSMRILMPEITPLDEIEREELFPEEVEPEDGETLAESYEKHQDPSSLFVDVNAVKEDLRARALCGPHYKYNMFDAEDPFAYDHDVNVKHRKAYFAAEKALMDKLRLRALSELECAARKQSYSRPEKPPRPSDDEIRSGRNRILMLTLKWKAEFAAHQKAHEEWRRSQPGYRPDPDWYTTCWPGPQEAKVVKVHESPEVRELRAKWKALQSRKQWLYPQFKYTFSSKYKDSRILAKSAHDVCLAALNEELAEDGEE